MLVLSRKVGESIVVGGGIRVTVTKIQGNRVQIGIEAPSVVAVRRAELAAFSESEGPMTREGKSSTSPKAASRSIRPAPLTKQVAISRRCATM
jgi:carbon storage regulator